MSDIEYPWPDPDLPPQAPAPATPAPAYVPGAGNDPADPGPGGLSNIPDVGQPEDPWAPTTYEPGAGNVI